MTEQQCHGIFLSHASEDNDAIVEPFIRCLEKAGISNIWYDNNQIAEDHSIIEKINKGLENSKVGIVIITPNFIRKPFTNWELECLTYLMIYSRIRLIPLRKNITKEDIIKKYSLLAPFICPEITNECDPKLIEHINNSLEMGNTLINNPNTYEIILNQEPEISKVIKKTTHKYNITNIDNIDKETIASIYNKIRSGSQEIKEFNITKIRTLSTNRRIWVHKETWDLIEYLIFSENIAEIKDGIYILGEMVKIAKSENDTYIVKNVEELFFFKLLGFVDPLKGKYISQDTLGILEIILENDVFFNIFISVLIKAMEDIPDHSYYCEYIQYFFNKIKKFESAKYISRIISRLENLIETSKKETTKERAKDFAQNIIYTYKDLL